jgi:RNA polymerase sigma-70 factor (ECF subfamily)
MFLPGAMTEPIEGIPPELLLRLQAGLRLLALYRLSDSEAAQEVVQEALARLLDAARTGRLPEPNRIGAYARGIAAHIITDHLRAQLRHLPIDTAPERLMETGADPLAQLVSQEEVARVRVALGALSASDRELLRLSYFEGLTPAELAIRLQVPGDRLRKRKQRALDRLRKAFLPSSGHKRTGSPTKGMHASALPLRAEGTE